MFEKPSHTRVAVIGGGTMGADVALVCARGGCPTWVVEPRRERREFLASYFAQTLIEMDCAHRQTLLSTCDALDQLSWSDIDLVIECVPERFEVKQRLFVELERLARPDAVLASNSSGLPISRIAQDCATAQRMIGLHFFMPAHWVPCVEVVCGAQTDLAVAQGLANLMTACAMVPVIVKKDLPGFLANRLQHALSREAFDLVDQGVASIEDIDKVVRFGFGFRYLAAGPALQRDHAGLDIHAAAGAAIYPSLNNSAQIAQCLRDRAERGQHGMKTGEGFYRWTPETIAAERARYREVLQAGLAIIRKEIVVETGQKADIPGVR